MDKEPFSKHITN